MKRLIACMVLALMALASVGAAGQEGRKTIVLIFPIKTTGVSLTDAQRADAKEYLGTRLTLEGAYSVMPESQVKANLGAAKVESYKECYDEVCRIDMTKTVYADKSLSVEVASEGSSCRITAVLYDIAQEATEAAADVETGCSFKEIKAGMVTAARQLSGRKSGGGAGAAAGTQGVVGGGTVTHGVQIDRGENIVNQMTDKTGLVFIETDPPKASLTINGKAYGTAPYQDELMVGRYIVTATLNSYYHDAAQEIQLTTGGARVKLVLPPAFGTLKVTSTPSDSEVLIDDKPVGRTPYVDERMKSGQYRVDVRRDLYAPASATVTVSDGRTTDQSLTLSADFGSLEVKSTPAGASIQMDGQATGKVTPATFDRVGSGLHIVTLDLDGYGRVVENVKMTAGGSQRVDARLEAKMGRLTVMTVDENGAPCTGTLTIDGKPMGETPWRGDLIATSHTVEAKCGDEEKVETVGIVHNEQKTLKLRTEPCNAIRWVRLPGGTFQMGSKGNVDEEPVHGVILSEFEIAETEVTVGQYKKCVDAGVCSAPHWNDNTCTASLNLSWTWGTESQQFEGSDQPVACVDWVQASQYSRWVGGRLPTEAEWEYAARSAGRQREYPWGDSQATCKYAVMWADEKGCGRISTSPVCSRSEGKTVQGLCDMAGNVSEYVADLFGKYSSGLEKNPKGPSFGLARVVRGGSWMHTARRVRVYDRASIESSHPSYDVGFRPARDVR